jgi:1-acyl-sn-glycerol-3-phosphate acyltransferase
LSIFSHSKAALSLLIITLNLLLWCVPLLLLGVAKAAAPCLRGRADASLEWIYRTAVRVDDFWLRHVMGLRWTTPHLDLPVGANVIALSNHVSWADVLLLQSLFARQGLILKFLTKRQLIFVPIFGIIFWAFDFPILRRRAVSGMSEEDRRRRDRDALAEACHILDSRPGVLVNFAEGTRATAEKRIAQKSPFEHLLRPKVGGFASLLDALDSDTLRIVDLTLSYPADHTFWKFLSGDSRPVIVSAEVLRPSEIPTERSARTDWLEERWRHKDRRIDEDSTRVDFSR